MRDAVSCLPITVKFVRLHPDAKTPTYAKPGDSGMDLYAVHGADLFPGEATKIGTGIALELPEGYEAQIRPRSGLSARGVACSFGTVDSGYRGEISIVLTLSPWCDVAASMRLRQQASFRFNAGDRIAQLVIMPVPRVRMVEVATVEELSKTERGVGGFGSSGK